MHVTLLVPLLLAGALGKLEPSTKVDLLGGRLVVSMPSRAKLEPRGRSIMEADAPVENETRVVLNEGPERLVLMANDLFATAGDDFLASVKAEVSRGEGAADYDIGAATAGLSAVSVTPKTLTTEGGGALVETYYLATADGLVATVSVYVNPAAAADPMGVKVLADKILASLTAGAKTLPHAGGRTKVAYLDNTRDLYADLPKDVVVSLQRGVDFDVARLRPLRKLGQEQGALGIYVGNHASFEKDAKAKSVPDTVLGFDVRWQLGEEEGWKKAAVLLTLPSQEKARGGVATMVHLFASAPDDADLAKLRALARVLSIQTR